MTSSLRSRHVIAAAATAIAIFLAVLTLLAVRVARGEDPALGAGTRQPVTASQTQAQAPTVVEEQPYETSGDEAYEDSYGEESYDSQGYDSQSGGTTVQPQTQAPLQSGTS